MKETGNETIELIIPALAFSKRTSALPIRIYDEDGKKLKELEATKRMILISVSKRAKYVIHFYESNRGHRSCYLYTIKKEEGFHTLDRENAISFRDDRLTEQLLQILKKEARSEMEKDVLKWLFGHF